MPAAWHRRRSSCMALAVSATMGRRRASDLTTRGRLALPDATDGLVSIHHGHLAVHEHQVVVALAHRLQGLSPITHDVEPTPGPLEHHCRNFLIDHIVLGYEHYTTRQRLCSGLQGLTVRPTRLAVVLDWNTSGGREARHPSREPER